MSNKKTETIQIFLNSKTANKYYDGYTSNCEFTLPHIVLPRSKTMYVSVQSASIPYLFYNVDGFNDTLVYSVGGGLNIVITIPQGNYNTSSLRTYLLSEMTGFTITYSSLNNIFTFTQVGVDWWTLAQTQILPHLRSQITNKFTAETIESIRHHIS